MKKYLLFIFTFLIFSLNAQYSQNRTGSNSSGSGCTVTLTFTGTPVASGNATLSVLAAGDIDGTGGNEESYDAIGEGSTNLGTGGATGDFADQCAGLVASNSFTISQAQVNSWRANGSITISFVFNGNVNCTLCTGGSQISATLSYPSGCPEIGQETGTPTAFPNSCASNSYGFGAGAWKDFTLQANTYYNFSFARSTNSSGYCGVKRNGSGGSADWTNVTAAQNCWFSGSTTSLRIISNRSGSTWSTNSSTLTYRKTTPTVNAGANQNTCNGSFDINPSVSCANVTTYARVAGTGSVNASGLVTGVPVNSSATIRVTANNSGCTATDDVIIYNRTPTAVSVSGGGTQCGGSRTITASGGLGGTIYFQGTTSGGTSTATASSSQSVSSSGTYYFRSRSSTGCWGAQGSVSVTINSVPAATTVSGGGTQCGGSRTITASGGAGGTIYFQGTTSNGTSTGTPSTSQSVSSSGTYYFRSRSAAGCWGPQGSVSVTINPIPAATTVSGGGTQCGGSRTITASGGSGGTIYFQGTTSNGTSTATASSSQSVSSSGTYYFRSRSAAGCWGPQGSVSVTINPVPAATTVSGGGTQCGGSRTITASGGSGGTIYFQGTTSNGTSTGTPSTSQSVSSSGTYYFRSRSAAGCWGPQGSVSVTINPIPAATTVSGGGTQCGGSRTITASGGSGGTIYFQGTTSNGTSTATASSSQSVSSSGTYYFRSRSAAGCWGPQGSVSVTINPVPAATTVSGGGTQCGGSRTITASGGSGGTIYFQGTTSNGTSTATASSSQSVSSSGTYYFRSRSAAGCWGPQGSVSVTINPVPAATTVSGGGTFCGSTTITAGGGAGGTIYFQGTTNNGTSTATASSSQSVSSSGTYYFRSRSAAGCWGPQGSVSVTIDAVPTASNAGPDQFACLTPAATMAANNPAVGTGAWTWTGPGTVSYQGGTSASDHDAQVLFSTSGTYTGTWTISNGVCTPSANTVDIEVNNPSTVVFADATGVCESVSVNDWVHLYNASGNIIASVRDNGQNIGDVTASVYYHGGNSFSVPANNGQCPGNWQAVLNRSFVINSTIAPSNDVDVRLYFTDAELADLVAQAGCGDPNGCADDDDVCGIGGLYVTQISGASSEDGTFVNGDGTFTLHTPSNGGTGNATFGANYVEVSVNGFSEFWIHGSESGVVLPVELLNFTAQGVDNTYIELNWATATEINNEGFEVLRSTDGVNFEPIAFVNGNGNTNTVHNYNHKDGAVVKGQTYYYQLKQIDFDGGYEYFDIKSARLDKDNEGIEISGFIPNPAEDKSVIRFSVTKEVRAMVSLYDITGKLVLTQEANLGNGENTISLNTTDLAAGTYNAKIIVGSDVYSRRLMINK